MKRILLIGSMVFISLLFLKNSQSAPTFKNEEIEERYYPNEIVIKFREDINEGAFVKEIFDLGFSFESFSSQFKQLDEILLQIEAKKIERLFPQTITEIEAKIPEYVKERIAPSSLARKINSALLNKYQKIKKKFPKRSARVPKNFNPPKLYHIYKINYEKNINPEKLAALIMNEVSSIIEYAHPNYISKLDFVPNDPYYTAGLLWNMDKINAPSAWDIETGDSDVIIADVEAGADYTHKDLEGSRIILPEGEEETNIGYHGTYVSGIMSATANNAEGVVGLAFNSKLMILDNYYIVDGADYGADIINTSWAVEGAAPSICEAVDYAYGLGALVVASAGNDNQNLLIQAPAQCERAISVGAVNSNDECADFSNFGINLDITAPGDCITSTGTNDSYVNCLKGTSFSTPHTSALAALVLSDKSGVSMSLIPSGILEKMFNQTQRLISPSSNNAYGISLEQIRQIIRKAAYKSQGDFDPEFGFGRIDAYQAVSKNYAAECILTSPTVNYYDNNYNLMVRTDAYEDAWTIVEGEFDITGTANCPAPRTISKYILDYGRTDSPASWVTISEVSNTSVIDGVLGQLDVSAINQGDGLFTLRLCVFDSKGEVYEDRMQFNIARALITNYPYESSQSLISDFITLEGFAGGPGFMRYYFMYSQDGINWIKFTDYFAASVNSNILLQDFNIQNVPLPGGELYIKLVVEDSIVGVSEDIVKVYVDSTNFPFQEGWPQSMSEDAVYGIISPLVSNIDKDADNEIISGYQTADNKVFVTIYSSTGVKEFETLLEKSGVSNYRARAIPVIGNINTDEYEEIGLFVYGDNNTSETLFILNKDGVLLNTWPNPTHSTYYSDVYEQDSCLKSPVFADLNKDGKSEIIYGTFGQNSNSGRLYVVDEYGLPFEGFNPYKETSFPLIKTPAAADLDNDGFLEVVAKDSYGNIYAWNHDGTQVTGSWPIIRDSQEYKPEYRNIVLADINNDNAIEVVDVYQPQDTRKTYVDVHDNNGEIVWSHLLPIDDNTDFYYIAAGELGGDGKLEVVLSGLDYDEAGDNYCGQIWVINYDGSLRSGFYPMAFCQNVDFYPGYPIIKDIDEDGLDEIIQSTYSRMSPYIFAVRGDGTKMDVIDRRWPIRKYGYTFVPLGISDIDGDGDFELLFNESSSTKIKIWDILAPYINAESNINDGGKKDE